MIDEAIRNLKTHFVAVRMLDDKDYAKDLKLGIEALERVRDARDIDPNSPCADLLPSEIDGYEKTD